MESTADPVMPHGLHGPFLSFETLKTKPLSVKRSNVRVWS